MTDHQQAIEHIANLSHSFTALLQVLTNHLPSTQGDANLIHNEFLRVNKEIYNEYLASQPSVKG